MKNKERKSFIPLKRKSDINNVFDKARVKRQGGFTLRAIENGVNITRLLIIPMHGYGNAVEINLLKRRVREIFRHCENIIPGYDIVIAVNKVEKENDYFTLKSKIERLLMHNNLITRGIDI